MKLVILNGSPRKNGATATLLKCMINHLEAKGNIDISYITITDYNLMDCTGCMACYKDGLCHLEDGVEHINGLISQADGLIIGSPTYSSSIPGSLKTFIDRGHFVLEQALKDKYTFALCTYEIAGGSSVLNQLKTLFTYSGGIISGQYMCKVPFNELKNSTPNVEKELLKKTDKYYEAILKQKKKSLLNRLVNFVALKVIMKPQVLKRPKQYQAVLKRWEENK